MSRLRQFGLLMQKNWILQKRKVCVTVFEILMPIIFGLLLLVIRRQISTTSVPEGRIWKALKASELVANVSKTEILFSPNQGQITTIMTAMQSAVTTQYPQFTCKFLIKGINKNH